MRQEIALKSGARIINEIIEDDHGGEIVTHFVIGADGGAGTKTCTCTCSEHSTSKTCDSSSNPTCDCSTPTNPKLTC